MPDHIIIFPLIIIFGGALIAALFGMPSLNRRLTAAQLSYLLALAPLAACRLSNSTILRNFP